MVFSSFRVSYLISTFFYAGRSPKAPGTAGSLAAFIPAYLLSLLPVPFYETLAVLSVLVFFIGIKTSDIVMNEKKEEDPGYIVIDEVVGQWIPLLFIPVMDIGLYALSFVFFRLFDIAKPFPVSYADKKIKGGTGVMLDDVFAGVYAAIAVVLIRRFLLS